MAPRPWRQALVVMLPQADEPDHLVVTPSKAGSTGISRRSPSQPSPTRSSPPPAVRISSFSSPRKRRRKSSSSWAVLQNHEYYTQACAGGRALRWALAWILAMTAGMSMLRWTLRSSSSQTHPLPFSLRKRSRRNTRSLTNETLAFVSPELVAPGPVASKTWTDGHVVHIIHTKFMQTQPDLVELGLARLEIFKTFCLPTMQRQTSQEYLWIIRTDPLLDERLKTGLLDLLNETEDNIVVVASNENPDHFSRPDALAAVTDELVWTGNYQTLVDYHTAAQSHVVLESRLDADDGLHVDFVRYMQQQGLQYLVPDPSRWMVWCAYSHLEWHYSSPFHESDPGLPEGYFVGVKTEACVTPGITTGYNTHVEGLPHSVNHQHLHEVIPPCHGENDTNCLRRLEHLVPTAIRARTPASAGMNNVLFGPFGHRSSYKRAQGQRDLQSAVWDGVHKTFGLDRPETESMRDYLGLKVKEIAADNWRGQCTKGHSCKHSAKQQLMTLIHNSWANSLSKK